MVKTRSTPHRMNTKVKRSKMNTQNVTLLTKNQTQVKKISLDLKHLFILAYWTSIHRNHMCNDRSKIKEHNPKHVELPQSPSLPPLRSSYHMQATISRTCKYLVDSQNHLTSTRTLSPAIETSHGETSPQRSTPTGIWFPNWFWQEHDESKSA